MHTEPSESSGFADDFRLGEWLVEPSVDRLSRNGTVVRLRPQLTDLLVLLARHAGQTVSKNVILATVWQGQHVAESGMTRCIAELRQALDDDAREPRILETIPKRGYRLVAPVVFLDRDGVSGAGTTASLPLVPAATAVSGPSPAAAPPAPQRLPRSVVWATGSSVGAVLLLAIVWGAGSWVRASALTERDTAVLADLTNTTGDRAFDDTVRLALAVHLGQAPFLRILSADRVRAALTLAGRPANEPVVGSVALEVCRRAGAAVLLAGSIARLGSHYAVGIEAIACRSGDSIGRELQEVDSKEQVLTGLGTVAARLRQKLGESRASLREGDVPVVRATTPSPDALRALSLRHLNPADARIGNALSRRWWFRLRADDKVFRSLP